MPQNMEMGARKFLAPEYIFGVDSRLMAADYCKKLGGRRVLLVSDEGIAKTPWLTEMEKLLEEHGLDYVLFTSISPNPRDEEVMEGKSVYEENHCNMILALGGGSVMDCAKGIGIVCSNKGHIRDFEGVDRILKPMPVLICIPTTGGSASDVSQFAIINHSTELYKFAIISKAVVPDVALVDPVVLTSMDAYLSAATGLDALSHAIEAFVSNANSAFTDLYALEAIRLIRENLHDSITHPENIQHRGKVMLASLYSGLAFSNASLGSTHSLAHSLGGYLDLVHGECNAILLPHVINYNYASARERYLKVAEVLQVPVLKGGVQKEKQVFMNFLIGFKESMGIKTTLKDKGVSSDMHPIMAAKAIKDPCNATNPKTPNKRDLEIVYTESM